MDRVARADSDRGDAVAAALPRVPLETVALETAALETAARRAVIRKAVARRSVTGVARPDREVKTPRAIAAPAVPRRTEPDSQIRIGQVPIALMQIALMQIAQMQIAQMPIARMVATGPIVAAADSVVRVAADLVPRAASAAREDLAAPRCSVKSSRRPSPTN